MTTKNSLFSSVCTCCGQPVTFEQAEDGDVAEHTVYKNGELHYVELAHRYCAMRDTSVKPDYWTSG